MALESSPFVLFPLCFLGLRGLLGLEEPEEPVVGERLERSEPVEVERVERSEPVEDGFLRLRWLLRWLFRPRGFVEALFCPCLALSFLCSGL